MRLKVGFFAARLFLSSLCLGLIVSALHAEAEITAPAPDVSQHLAELRAEITHHDALYFQQDSPVISDAAYDRLKQELRDLEAAHPELAVAPELTDDRSELFQSYRHRAPMLSLDKAYAEADVRAFYERIGRRLGHPDLACVIEPKVDGLSVSVTYDHGTLVRAATRGNGLRGDDITAHARVLRNLPTALRGPPDTIPDLIEVRGEIYVPWLEFERVNREREASGEPPFANPRNLAAGTIRQVNSAEVAARGLAVIFYGFAACQPSAAAPRSQQELHRRLRAWGLPAFDHIETARGAAELWQAVTAVGKTRAKLGFPTDGAVIKVDEVALQQELGEGDTTPHWALAFKFAPDQAETRLRGITLQVGRTGVLTPVAELEPVTLSGTRVSRATLHNRDEITRKDLRIGDYVRVEKAGEIIPAIVGVNLERRPPDLPPYRFPATCPACGTTLVNASGEAAVRCPNPACPAQLRRRLEYFASKSCVAIEGLGPAAIAALVENGKLKGLADLYRLRLDDFRLPGRSREAAAEKILAAVEQSKHAELWRFIRGLGIADVGEAAARQLGRRFASLSALASSQSEDLKGISDRTARAVLGYFDQPENRRLIAELTAAGVDPQPER